jgi:hypothetical protein
VLALHPALPPGIDVEWEPAGERTLHLALAGPATLLDPDAPGWLGLLARGETRALEAIAQAVEPRARVQPAGRHAFTFDVDPARAPVDVPQSVALTRLSTVAAWRFRHGS